MPDYQDATYLADLIKKGEITAVEAVEQTLNRIHASNDEYRAVHELFEDRALRQAEEMKDFSAPFAGVPILLKDLGQAYEGGLNSSGSSLLKNNRASQTNHLVQSILDAGFIVVGQSNVPEFGIKFISDSKCFGTVKNPVNPHYHAGGSSGGSAAAVQLGMVPLAAASDGGGSIRIPASFSGLIGLKPSTGRMATGPSSWRSWGGGATNFAVTRSMRDTETLFMAMQTFAYPAMPFRLPTITESQLQDAHQRVKELRIAYTIRPDYDSEEAVKAMQETVGFLADHDFKLEEVRVDVDIPRLHQSYYLMNAIEIDKILTKIEEGMGRPVDRDELEPLSWALRELGKKIPAAEYSMIFDLWDQTAASYSQLFQGYDVLLHPSTAKPAPTLDSVVYDDQALLAIDNVSHMKRDDLQASIRESLRPANQLSPYALIDNLAGVPAISLPLHTCSNGLPLGLQFSAAKGREDLLLALGSYIENQDYFEYYF